IHAYDFLTSWDQAGVWANFDKIPYLPNGGTPVGTLGLSTHANDSLPGGSTSLHVAGNNNFVDVPIPADPFVDPADGSTAARFTAYQNSSVTGGLPPTVRIWGDPGATSTFSLTSLTVTGHSGPTTGDSSVAFSLTWTSTSANFQIEF